MKRKIRQAILPAAFVILTAAIPCLAYAGENRAHDKEADRQSAQTVQSEQSAQTVPQPPIADSTADIDRLLASLEPYKAVPESETILLYHTVSGEIEELSMLDYVTGAVLAEMPASFNTEALKAQAVVCRTYAARRKLSEALSPDESLHGAHISDDSSIHQAYFTKEQGEAFYGADYAKNYSKVYNAAVQVINEVIVYENEPIVAAFHSLSSGRTESSEAVWGGELAYLTPVDSSADIHTDNYRAETSFTPSELKARLSTACPDISFSDSEDRWVTVLDRTSSGTVTSVVTGDKVMSGTELRSILSLRSACFDVSYLDGRFTFVTRGYGHGVGMSQYGANAMAEAGSDYRDIISHYYTGVSVIETG